MTTAHKRHFASQGIQHTGEFYRNITGSYHRNLLWLSAEFEEVIRGQAMLSAWNIRTDRLTARGKEQVRGKELISIDLYGKRMALRANLSTNFRPTV